MRNVLFFVIISLFGIWVNFSDDILCSVMPLYKLISLMYFVNLPNIVLFNEQLLLNYLFITVLVILLQCNNLCKPTLSEHLPSDTTTATSIECTGKTQDHRRCVYPSSCCCTSDCYCECGYIVAISCLLYTSDAADE